MWLLLPVATVAIIAVVSILFFIVIIVAVIRSNCCRKRKDKTDAKGDELDRFLKSEESEDEEGKLLQGDKSYEEGTFHFVDVHVEEEVHVDKPLEHDTVPAGLDEVLTLGYEHVVIPEEHVATFADEEPNFMTEDKISITPSSPVGEIPPIEVTSLDAPVTETLDLLTVPTGSKDYTSDHSDDASNASVYSNVSGTKEKMIGLEKESEKTRSSQRIYSTFSENANLKIRLQYIESVKCLKGSIMSIEGLNLHAEHCPHEINFHLRFVPNKKFHIATKYKAISNDTGLNLTFTMGPVYTEDLINNTLRVKLYGKKAQRLTRSKCYGECSFSLQHIVGKLEPTEFEEYIIQRASGSAVYSSDSDGVM